MCGCCANKKSFLSFPPEKMLVGGLAMLKLLLGVRVHVILCHSIQGVLKMNE